MPGGSRRLDITLHYDTSPAEASSQAFTARELRREKDRQTAAQVAEKAKTDLVKRETAARTAESGKAQAAEQDRLKKLLTAEQANERAREALVEKLNAKRVELASRELLASDRSARQTLANLDKQLAGFDRQNKAVLDGVTAIGRFGAAMVGLGSAQAVIQMFVAEFQAAREYAAKTADDIQRMREGIRELQALRGEMGQTGPGVAHVFQMASQTLQTPEEVKAMESAGLGVGELAIGDKGTMTRAEFDKLMVAAGKFQSLEGGNAAAYGQLAGQIALTSDHKMSAAEGEARMERLFRIQQPGGFATMSSAIGQYAKLNPLVQNKVLSPEEAMGLLSAMSVSSPEEAATMTNQFTRAVLGGRLRARGMAMSPDVDAEKSNEYLASIGAAKETNPLKIGEKIAADIAKQQAANKDFNVHDYLMTRGFQNQEDRLSIMAFSGLKNSGRLGKIEEAMKSDLDEGAVSRKFAERAAKDPFFARRAAQLSEEAADTAHGAQTEDVKAAMQAAFARMRQQGRVGTWEEGALTGNWQDFEEIYGSSGLNPRNLLFGDRERLQLEAQHMVAEQAKKVGINFREPTHYNTSNAQTETDYIGDEKLKQLILQVRQAGGNPLGGVEGDIKAMAADIRRMADAAEKQAPGKGIPPAMPGRPAAQPVRP